MLCYINTFCIFKIYPRSVTTSCNLVFTLASEFFVLMKNLPSDFWNSEDTALDFAIIYIKELFS